MGSTLTMTSGLKVILTGGASPSHIYWIVGSSATLGTTTSLSGNLLALTSITLDTGATVCGRVLANTGAVTMDHNKVSGP
jgi:type VI secretion system secreted protein VgrG